jgi:hypothetical protein
VSTTNPLGEILSLLDVGGPYLPWSVQGEHARCPLFGPHTLPGSDQVDGFDGAATLVLIRPSSQRKSTRRGRGPDPRGLDEGARRRKVGWLAERRDIDAPPEVIRSVDSTPGTWCWVTESPGTIVTPISAPTPVLIRTTWVHIIVGKVSLHVTPPRAIPRF